MGFVQYIYTHFQIDCMIIEIKCHVKAWGRENELISIHMNVGSEMEMKFDIYVYDKLFIFMACLRYVTLHLSVA